MAPTLYYTEISGPVRSVLLTGKALGIEFDLKPVNLATGEHLKPEFLKINPQHTVPTLVDSDGFALWDSHAINAYLVGKYGKDDSLYPKDLKKRAIVDQRLHFNNGILIVRFSAIVKGILYKGAKEVTKEQKDGLIEAFGFLEKFLEKNEFVAGNQMTIADLHIITSVTTAAIFAPVSSTDFPKLSAWIKKMQSLPYYKEANEKGLKMFEGFMKSKLA